MHNQAPNVNASLNKQIALVTGGGRGIGAALAHKLAGLGATVVICGRTRPALETTNAGISRMGGLSELAVCDLTNLDSVQKLAAEVKSKFGRLEILHEMAPDAWDVVLNTNLRGVYYCIRNFASMMIQGGGGHIINISSLAGKNPLPNGAAYAASKWALNGLSYSVAEELRGHNIRVSVICPGSVQTDLSPHEGKDAKKMLQPDDVAHAVEMLVTQAPQSFVSEVLLRPTQKP
jgi:NAD(P)-dependent dehydrogenase (short-subunit alcohol dehydrogenase family)